MLPISAVVILAELMVFIDYVFTGILPAAGFFCLSFCGENQVDNSLVVADTEFFRWINAVKWSPRRTTQNSILKVAIETGYIEHAAFTKGKLKCLRGAPRGMF